jgi:hypothetical protein
MTSARGSAAVREREGGAHLAHAMALEAARRPQQAIAAYTKALARRRAGEGAAQRLSALLKTYADVAPDSLEPQGLQAALGLEFRGFDLPEARTARFRLEHAGAEPMRDLEAWEAFESAHPRTFAGMYRFWCGTREDG